MHLPKGWRPGSEKLARKQRRGRKLPAAASDRDETAPTYACCTPQIILRLCKQSKLNALKRQQTGNDYGIASLCVADGTAKLFRLSGPTTPQAVDSTTVCGKVQLGHSFRSEGHRVGKERGSRWS